MERPLSERSDEAFGGSFRYLREIPSDLEGVFAFSFYIPYEAPSLEGNPYLLGITLYADVIQKKGSLFSKWKVVLYTDAFTLRVLESNKDTSLLNNPSVYLVIVSWPYYETVPGKVNEDMLRCMRFRAFFDFPNLPVFVRDADTLWAITDYATQQKLMNKEPEFVSEWETNFFRGAQEHPNTWIFGTSAAYISHWHITKRTGLKTPVGAFAGFQSVMPTVPCFTSNRLWEKALDYITSLSKRTNKGFSNERDTSRIGKDEQLLVYIFLPACWDSLFFFEVDLFGDRRFALDAHGTGEVTFPTYIFRRGNNSNLRALFRKAVNTGFQQNLEGNRKAILKKNAQKEEQKEAEIGELFKQLGDLEYKIAPDAKSNVYLIPPSTGQEAARVLSQRFGPTDATLRGLHQVYLKGSERLIRKKQAVSKRMKEGVPVSEITPDLEDMRKDTAERNRALEAIIRRALELHSKEDLIRTTNSFTRASVQRTLDFFTGGPVAPPSPVAAPRPSSSTNEFDFLQLGETILAGGKRNTRRKRKGKKKTRKN